MKCIVFVAALALVSAVPVEEKKQTKEQNGNQNQNKQADASGLPWPLPEASSEGDLMLHGIINFNNVEALHKGKVEDDVDKMILAHGRNFLRRVNKFFDDNSDIKIMPILCRDARNLNGTNRWKIEIPKANNPAEGKEEQQQQQQQGNQKGNQNQQEQTQQNDAPEQKDKPEKHEDAQRNNTNENETSTTVAPSSSPSPSDKPNPSSEKPTTIKPAADQVPAQGNYENLRREFYRQVGANFARLLMKEYRKEKLIPDESEYLQRWLADEAVHYGAMGIYCQQNENVKDIKKQLASFLEEKN